MITELTTKENNTEVMTSLELLEVINKYRLEDGKNEMRHADFLKKVEDELEGDERKFSSVYLGGNNEERKCYNLPKDECLLMAMRESKYVRKQTVAYIKQLESGVKPTLPTTIKEVALLLLQSEEEKELLLEQNKTIVKVSTKKSLQTYTPTKLLAFLYKEGIVSPTDGLAVSDINVALTFAGYQTKQTSPRNGSYVHSYSLTDKGVEFAVQQVSGMTTSCKWLYTITKQQDFIDVINSIVAGEFY